MPRLPRPLLTPLRPLPVVRLHLPRHNLHRPLQRLLLAAQRPLVVAVAAEMVFRLSLKSIGATPNCFLTPWVASVSAWKRAELILRHAGKKPSTWLSLRPGFGLLAHATPV